MKRHADDRWKKFEVERRNTEERYVSTTLN
jgi:hypothetical protein